MLYALYASRADDLTAVLRCGRLDLIWAVPCTRYAYRGDGFPISSLLRFIHSPDERHTVGSDNQLGCESFGMTATDGVAATRAGFAVAWNMKRSRRSSVVLVTEPDVGA